MCISHTGVVDAHPGHSDVTLAFGEAFHSDWVGWHEEEDDEGPEYGYGAADKVHIFPGGESAGDVAQTIIYQWTNHRHWHGR